MTPFFENLSNQLKDRRALINTVSEVLGIHYDAAHRRVNGKSKLSLEEAVVLAEKFNFSIDEAVLQSDSNVLFRHTTHIENLDDYVEHIQKYYQKIIKYLNDKTAMSYYSARDIPVFYTIGYRRISKLKLYSWLWTLDPKFQKHKIHFNDFIPPENLVEHARRMVGWYEFTNSSEIWNRNTLQLTFNQLEYFYHSKLISKIDALLVLEDAQKIITQIGQQARKGQKKSGNIYILTENNVDELNNFVLIKNNKDHLLFIPFNMSMYFQSNEDALCQRQHALFEKMLSNGTSLSGNLENDDLDCYINHLFSLINEEKQKYT